MSLYHSFLVSYQSSFKNIRVLKPISLAICFLLIFVVGKVSADYFVSNSGSDSNPGTKASPYRTLQKVAKMVSAGDTVYVREGTYGNFTIYNKHGKAGSWITIQPYNNEEVIIDSYKNNYANGVQVISLNDCSYIELNGLEVRESNPLLDSNVWEDYAMNGKAISHDGIKMNNTNHHIRIINCTIHHLGANATGMSQYGHHCEFINNHCYDVGKCKRGYGLYWAGDDNIVRGNIFHDCYGRGINTYSAHSGHYPDRNLIEQNICYNNGRSDYGKGWSGFPANGQSRGPGIMVGAVGKCYDNIIRNNICYGNIESGIVVYSNANRTVVENNTCYNNTMYGVLLWRCANVKIRNNISYQNSRGDYSEGTDVTNPTRSNNLFGVDPKFVDLPNRNFHLQPASPAIDTGLDTNVTLNDYEGNPRPIDGNGDGVKTCDIGAYEYFVDLSNGITPPKGFKVSTISF